MDNDSSAFDHSNLVTYVTIPTAENTLAYIRSISYDPVFQIDKVLRNASRMPPDTDRQEGAHVVPELT